MGPIYQRVMLHAPDISFSALKNSLLKSKMRDLHFGGAENYVFANIWAVSFLHQHASNQLGRNYFGEKDSITGG